MYLSKKMWESFSTYLFIDKKLAQTPRSAHSLHSRFVVMSRFFEDKKFNRDNFNAYIQQMVLAGYKNTYINGFIKLAKHIDKWLKINELQDYTYFREKDEEYEILTTEEIKALAEVKIAYVRDCEYQQKRNRALIYFISLTGCRIFEALDLTWHDVRSSPIPHVIFRDTKNGEDRHAPLRGEVYNMLLDLPKRSERVFDSKDDKRLSLDLKKRAEAIKLSKRVWWHLFRHSYVTTMLEQGVDALIVAKIVGHKDPRSTQRYNQTNLSSLAVSMDIHPLCKENQTMELVTKHLKGYIDKLLNSSLFTLSTEENSRELTIKIKRAYC